MTNYHHGQYLFLNAQNATRVSALDGLLLESVEDLPSFRVELHKFNSSNEAEAFVAGLNLSGLGNTIVYDWNTGDTASNRCVFIGRLDEPAAQGDTVEKVLVLVEHKASRHDSEAIARHLTKSIQETHARHDQDDIDSEPVRKILTEGGADVVAKGSRWVRFGAGPEISGTVTWKVVDGPFKLKADVYHALDGTLDVGDVVSAAAEGLGFACNVSARELHYEVPNLVQLADLPDRMKAVAKACEEAKSKAWREDFIKRTKMTPSRKRFLAAGLDGIRTYVNRANLKARAGGLEIGQTEINTLLHRGWIGFGGDGYVVTEEGKADAGLLAAPVEE